MEDLDISELTQESLEELKTTSLRRSVETSVDVVSAAKNTFLEKIIDCAKFSSLSHLWHVTGYVLRFVSNLKKTTQKMEVKFSPVLTAEEVRKAENLWIVSIQQNLLHDPKYEQWKSQVCLWMIKDRLDVGEDFLTLNFLILQNIQSYFPEVILKQHLLFRDVLRQLDTMVSRKP